jgi:hypothetical protein
MLLWEEKHDLSRDTKHPSDAARYWLRRAQIVPSPMKSLQLLAANSLRVAIGSLLLNVLNVFSASCHLLSGEPLRRTP